MRRALVALSLALAPARGCLRASLALPERAFTSAGVYAAGGAAPGRLVRTLWSRRELAAGALSIAWDGRDDAGALAPECADEAAAAAAYEVKVLSSNVSYVWEGTVGNSGRWQVGPWVLRALYAIADLDVADGVGAYVFGYCERGRAAAVFNVSAPSDLSFVSRENYHSALTAVATDGELVYIANSGVPAAPPSYYFDPHTFVYAVDLAAPPGPTRTFCEANFTFGVPTCSEGYNQGNCTQKIYDGCNGAEQYYNSVIDLRVDSGVINTTRGHRAYPSAPTGIAVQRAPGTLLAVAHGHIGVVSTFHKKTGAPLANLSVPGGALVGPIRFSADGASLWAVTSAGVVRYGGVGGGAARLAVELTVPLSVIAAPANLGVDAASGRVLVTDDATQTVFVLDGATGAVVGSYGLAGGYTAARGPAVRDDLFFFENSSYVAADGAGGLFVGDQGNSRTLHLSANGTKLDDMSFITASYKSAVAHGAPSRVFSSLLEFEVNASVPLGAPGSWKLVRVARRARGVPRPICPEFRRPPPLLLLPIPSGQELGCGRRPRRAPL
jgi:hypothetical protein